MSHRPIRDKQVNRLRKALRVTPPRFLDLVQWLKDHRYAQTTGEARRILLAKRVRHGSHKIGFVVQDVNGEQVTVLDPFVPSDWRSELIVVEK